MTNLQSLFFHTEVPACLADLPIDAPARELYDAIKTRGREALRQHKESLQTQLRANCRVAALTLVVDRDELYRLDKHEELDAFIRAAWGRGIGDKQFDKYLALVRYYSEDRIVSGTAGGIEVLFETTRAPTIKLTQALGRWLEGQTVRCPLWRMEEAVKAAHAAFAQGLDDATVERQMLDALANARKPGTAPKDVGEALARTLWFLGLAAKMLTFMMSFLRRQDPGQGALEGVLALLDRMREQTLLGMDEAKAARQEERRKQGAREEGAAPPPAPSPPPEPPPEPRPPEPPPPEPRPAPPAPPPVEPDRPTAAAPVEEVLLRVPPQAAAPEAAAPETAPPPGMAAAPGTAAALETAPPPGPTAAPETAPPPGPPAAAGQKTALERLTELGVKITAMTGLAAKAQQMDNMMASSRHLGESALQSFAGIFKFINLPPEHRDPNGRCRVCGKPAEPGTTDPDELHFPICWLYEGTKGHVHDETCLTNPACEFLYQKRPVEPPKKTPLGNEEGDKPRKRRRSRARPRSRRK